MDKSSQKRHFLKTKLLIIIVLLSGCGQGSVSDAKPNALLSAIDDSFEASRNSPTISPNVLLNDETQRKNVAGLHVTAFTQATRGNVVYNENGTFTYAPNAAKNAGEDQFTYTVADETGATKSATVHVTLLKGWDTPWNLNSNDIKHFTFRNGDMVLLWHASSKAIFTRIFRAESGWEDVKVLVAYANSWAVVQNPDSEEIVLAAIPTLQTTPNSQNILARTYDKSKGWSTTPSTIAANRWIPNAYFYPQLTLTVAGNRVIALWPETISIIDGAKTLPGQELWGSVYDAAKSSQWSDAVKIDQARDKDLPFTQLVKVFSDDRGRVIVLWKSYHSTGYTSTNNPTYLWANGLSAGSSQNWMGPKSIDKTPALATDDGIFYGDPTSYQDAQGNLSLAWRRNGALWVNRISWDAAGTLRIGLGGFLSQVLTSPVQLQGANNPDPISGGNLYFGGDSVGNMVLAWTNNNKSQVNDPPVDYTVASSYSAATGAWAMPSRVDDVASETDGSSDILGISANAVNSLVLVWNKKVYSASNNLLFNNGAAELIGVNMLTKRFVNGAKSGQFPLILQNFPMTNQDIYNSGKGFLQLSSPTPTSLLLLTATANPAQISSYKINAYNFTNWATDTSAPPSAQLTTSAGAGIPRFLASPLDHNGNMNVFWAQDEGVYSLAYMARLNTKAFTWSTERAQLWSNPNDSLRSADEVYYSDAVLYSDFKYSFDNGGNIVTQWGCCRNNRPNLINRTLSEISTDSIAAGVLQLPTWNNVGNIQAQDLWASTSGAIFSMFNSTPSSQSPSANYGATETYITTFH